MEKKKDIIAAELKEWFGHIIDELGEGAPVVANINGLDTRIDGLYFRDGCAVLDLKPIEVEEENVPEDERTIIYDDDEFDDFCCGRI